MDSAQRYDVAIIGAGLAGATVASELANQAPPDFRVLVIGSDSPGPGTAFAPSSDRLLMNGGAGSMSAVPGDKEHLLRWLQTAPPEALIARRRFGIYLANRFREALAQRPAFASVHARATDLRVDGDGFAVVDDVGTTWRARSVVLAFGTFAPDDAFLPPAVRDFVGYVGDPWRFDGRVGEGDSLIVGSGLTALDAVAQLDERGFRGTIHLISRHGLIPALEEPRTEAAQPSTLDLRTETPLALLRSLRAAARRRVAEGGDWREIVEAIRGLSPDIWQGWSLRERRRFLRHLQAFWTIHRYRVPPETAATFARLRERARLFVHRGQIVAATERAAGLLSVEMTNLAHSRILDVASVVNCTGPNGDYHRVNDPLIRNLIRRGTIRPDALRLGIDATPDFHPLDRRGHPHERLFTLGPPLRGVFYETTAVPETIAQAAAVARGLVGDALSSQLRAAS